MPDFITERDPIIVFTPQPNTHGKSPEEFVIKQQIKKLEKEHLLLCNKLEEINCDWSDPKYQDTIKEIQNKWKEVECATKSLMDLEKRK